MAMPQSTSLLDGLKKTVEVTHTVWSFGNSTSISRCGLGEVDPPRFDPDYVGITNLSHSTSVRLSSVTEYM